MSSPWSLLKSLCVIALLAAAGLGRLFAQGGPPMITDDPGTPGPDKWEINLGWTTEKTSGTTLYGLPLLDANYGIGDRIEMTYEAPWGVIKDEDGTRDGAGNSLFGVKWRFLDEGEKGWQASIYPQVTFVTPGYHTGHSGLEDPGTSVLLPFEVEKDLGPVAINFDCGHVFSSEHDSDLWMAGVIVGREVVKGWELDAEVHVNTSNRFGRSEWIANTGTRIDLSEHLTLMIALGTDLSNQLGPQASLLSYLGFQLRL